MNAVSSWLLSRLLRLAGRALKRRFDAQSHQADRVNQRLLFQILKRNQETEFGKRHRFGALQTVDDFRREVPLATYNDVRSDMERVARGEQNVLTVDPPIAVGLSSGTTGTQKQLILTAREQGLLSPSIALLAGAFVEASIGGTHPLGKGISLMSARLRESPPGGLPTGALTAVTMTQLLKRAPGQFLSPPEAYLIQKSTDAAYVHLLFGLAEPSLEYLRAPLASGVLDLFHVLEHQGVRLVEDLLRGTLSPQLEIEPSLRTAIEARLRPQEAASRRLAQALSQGMDGLALRLWPQLKYISTIVGGNFSVYAQKLRRYAGPVPLFSPAYVATEGTLGMGMKAEATSYVLLPTTVFFEFIPVEAIDDAAPQTRLLHELAVGAQYEVVLTNCNGLYRYRLGDVIQVVEHHGRLPVVEVLFRRGGLLDIAGEKTSEHAAREALREALGQEGLSVVDFTTQVDVDAFPQRYVFFVELEREDRAPPVDEAQVSQRLQAALCRANPRYEAARSKLGPVVLYCVRLGTFRELRDRLVQRGISQSQAKVPRLLPEGPLATWLRERRVQGSGKEA